MTHREVKVKTKKKSFWSANIIEVGTNTPMGGNWSHGGETIFKLKPSANTDMKIRVSFPRDLYVHPTVPELEGIEELTIELFGDTEAETFADALFFAWQTLARQIEENTVHTRKKRFGSEE